MLAFREDYHQEDWPENFLEKWRQQDEENQANLLRLHRFVRDLSVSGKYLEIGSGPSPIGIFSASLKFRDITLSDFSRSNINYLKRWKDGKVLHPNILHLLKYIAKLESKDDLYIENEARCAVKDIKFSDLLKNDIVSDDNQFAAISMNFVLLCACKTKADVQMALKNIYNKIISGGRLFDFGALNAPEYDVGEKKFSHFDIDLEEIVKIARNVGFNVLNYEEIHTEKNCYCLIASK